MQNQQFRHNPTAVEALLFTGENHLEAADFLRWPEPRSRGITGSGIVVDERHGIHALPNDYILRDLNDNLSVMPAPKFTEAFRPVDPKEALPGTLLEDYLANPSVIWYGRHPCSECGETIIRSELEQGGVKLDAQHDHHYPNHQWTLHECSGQRTVAVAVPEEERNGDGLMGVQRKCPFPPIPVSSTPPAVVAAGQHDPKILRPLAAADDLPGALALAQGVAEQRWPHTMDAQVWADEWLTTIADKPGIPTDRETMVGWFANAIMAGYDTAQQRAASETVAA